MTVKPPEAPLQSLPIVINYHEVAPLTDDDLLKLSHANKNLKFERTAQGDLVIMSPTGSLTSDRNSELNMQLRIWAKQDGRGKVYDSSGGFRLPDNALRSPDSAWVLKSRIERLSDEEQQKYLPLCPDFVIELLSDSDSLPKTQTKMQEYLENGAQLGWLIDPEEKQVHVYTPDSVEVLNNPETVSGGELLAGFELDLTEVW